MFFKSYSNPSLRCIQTFISGRDFWSSWTAKGGGGRFKEVPGRNSYFYISRLLKIIKLQIFQQNIHPGPSTAFITAISRMPGHKKMSYIILGGVGGGDTKKKCIFEASWFECTGHLQFHILDLDSNKNILLFIKMSNEGNVRLK